MFTKIKNKLLRVNKYESIKNNDFDLENQIELKNKNSSLMAQNEQSDNCFPDMKTYSYLKKDKFELKFDKSLSFFRFAYYLIRKANIFYSPIIVTLVSICLDILNGYFLAQFNKEVPTLIYLISFGFLRMIKVPFTEYIVKKQQIEDRCNIHVELYKFVKEKQSYIKYIDRCKMNKTKLNKLTSRMDNHIQFISTWAFSNFIDLFSGILFTTILFYKNGFILFGIFLYMGFLVTMKLVAYPLIKKHNEKRKEEYKNKREELEAKICLLEYGYEPFPENIEKYESVLKIKKDLNLLYEKIYRLPYGVLLSMQWIGELILFIYLIWYHEEMQIKNQTNYYLLASASIQLFGNFSNFMYTLSQIEKIFADYDEFIDFFDKLEFNEKKVESNDFPENYILDVKYCIYDNYVLKGTLKFKLGESICFTGERGCGKSTLAKYIAGYLYKDDDLNNYRQRVIYVEQDIGDKWANNKLRWKDCFEEKSIQEIKYILNVFSFPVEKIIKDSTTIDDIIPFTLSGGEKKSLQYATFLNNSIFGVQNNTQIIIFDEPFNQLDEQTGLNLMKNLKNHYQNITLIMIKHEKPVELSDWIEYNIDSNGNINLIK